MKRNPGPKDFHYNKNGGYSKNRKHYRIRIALVLLVLIFAKWKLDKNKQKSKGNFDNIVATVPKIKEKKILKPGELRDITALEKKTRKKPKAINSEALKKMLKENSPKFNNSIDTIIYKGWKVARHFSIDTTLQQKGMGYFDHYLPKYGAVAIIEPSTGRIISLISYSNPEEKEIGDKLYTKSLFPAASIIKTVTAAAVIDKRGFNSSTKIKMNGKNHTLFAYQLTKSPKKFVKRTLEDAFAFSLNPIFGRLGMFYIKKEGMKEYAKKFGFNSKLPFEIDIENSKFIIPDREFGLAEASSGFHQETTLSPILGSLIAGSITNNGIMMQPSIVDSIVDINSKKVQYRRKDKVWKKAISKKTSQEMKRLMKSVAQKGTAKTAFKYIKTSPRFDSFDYGGKTGNVEKDGYGKAEWFVGFLSDPENSNHDLACAVLTVHSAKWTVHSSYIGAEMMRNYIMALQKLESEG